MHNLPFFSYLLIAKLCCDLFNPNIIFFPRPGSIIIKGIAQYNYPNNQSQIDFLNKDLEPSLKWLFNHSDLFKNLSEALGNVSVQDTEVVMQTAEIASK